jgi:microcin C transport system permease protein
MIMNKELKVKLGVFRNDRRAFYSFIILATLFVLTLPAEILCNIRPLVIVVDGKTYFPIAVTYSEKDFGGNLPSEPDYKSQSFSNLLSGTSTSTFANTEDSGLGLDLGDFEDDVDTPDTIPASSTKNIEHLPRNFWLLWPPVRFDYKYIPTESITGNVVLAAPYKTKSPINQGLIESSWMDGHYLGTDDRGRDVLARLIYGFRISMLFGFSLAITGTLIGCLIGGTQGFFGGWVDLTGQRLTEIWGSIPRLYILIILSSFLVPSALLLFLILNLTAWMGIAAYIRAEFLKIRNYEFVKAAKSLGVSNFKIMRRHILPNALTPVLTFFPFEVTAGILALVSLDFLNLGVPSPAPSLGELLAQGKNNLHALWILLPTFVTLSLAITLLTFIGEGIRNAFDPRKTL